MKPDQEDHHQPTDTPNNQDKPIRFRLALLLTALLFVVLGVAPALANEGDACIGCHGNYDSIHLGLAGHGATSQIGSVVLFANDAHDEAGWYGPQPYFEVPVNCSTCHTDNLLTIHANSCSTCHPTKDISFKVPDVGNVTFSHDVHTSMFSCSDCHPGLFIPGSGNKTFTMDQMGEGESCGACHDGDSAFTVNDNCDVCHQM